MNNETTLAIVAILATCVGALVWVIKFMFTKIVPLLESLTTAVEKNTLATEKADQYLKKRNGRDNEMHQQVLLDLRSIRNSFSPERTN